MIDPFRALDTSLPKINANKYQNKKIERKESSSESSEKEIDPVNLFSSVLSLTENDRFLVYDVQKRLNEQK